jgi:pimeloyl-ACP methyl ester carboxylesterase
MQQAIEKDISVNGQLVHYYHSEAVGEEKGTLLFLHGWGSNSTLWFTSCMPLSEKGYELYFLDLPGFGKSELPKQPFHLDDYVHIVTQFIHKLEIPKPTVIGHSFGGKTAIRLAAKNKALLNGLVLVDSSGLPHTTFSTQTKIKIAHTVKPIMDLPFMQGIRSHLLRMAGSDDYIATPGLRETFVNIISEHVEFDLPNIDAPTLIIWGGNDDNTYTPVSDVSVLHRLIPGAEAHIIQGAGHYSFLDAPSEFFQTLLEFLDIHNGKN